MFDRTIGDPAVDALLTPGAYLRAMLDAEAALAAACAGAGLIPAEAAARIAECARGVAGVCDAYAIRSRRGVHRGYAELTISVDGGATVAEAHGIADQVEARLRRELDLHEVTVHVEPC